MELHVNHCAEWLWLRGLDRNQMLHSTIVEVHPLLQRMTMTARVHAESTYTLDGRTALRTALVSGNQKRTGRRSTKFGCFILENSQCRGKGSSTVGTHLPLMVSSGDSTLDFGGSDNIRYERL